MTCELCAEGGHRYDMTCESCVARDLARAPRSVLGPRLKLIKGRTPEADYQRLLGLIKQWHDKDNGNA